MPRHVVLVSDPVDGFRDHFAGAADDDAIGIFALPSRPHCERDAARHHLATQDFRRRPFDRHRFL
jgi:hypothetical protein